MLTAINMSPLNNQLTDFSFRSADADGNPIANAPAGGKRPRSSMSPTIVFNPDGEFLFTTGSPGGNSIIAYTAKTIVGILDWGLTPQQAIELPNVIARNGRVSMEAKGIKDETTQEVDRGSPAEEFGMSQEIVAALEAKGHKVRRSKGEFNLAPISKPHKIIKKDEFLTADMSNGYDAVAETFMRVRSPIIGCATIQKWTAALPTGGTILDIGAGSGHPLTAALVDDGFDVYAIDASPKMVKALRQHLPNVDHYRLGSRLTYG